MELDTKSKTILSRVVTICSISEYMMQAAVDNTVYAIESGTEDAIAVVNSLAECALVGKDATSRVYQIPSEMKQMLDSDDHAGLEGLDTLTIDLLKQVQEQQDIVDVLVRRLQKSTDPIN